MSKYVTKSKALSRRHKRFADHYFRTGNAIKSYKYVYGVKKHNTAKNNSGRVLRRADVRAYLDSLEEKVTDAVVQERVASEAEVLEIETKLIRSNIVKALDENGVTMELRDWPQELQECIKDVKYGFDPTTQTRYISEIKFLDKGQALNRIEKCFGMHIDRTENKHSIVADVRVILAEIDGMNRDGGMLKLPQDCD